MEKANVIDLVIRHCPRHRRPLCQTTSELGWSGRLCSRIPNNRQLGKEGFRRARHQNWLDTQTLVHTYGHLS